jgi:hypothetical protein
MTLMLGELKDSLSEIAKALLRKDYRTLLNRELKPMLNNAEAQDIITACTRIASVLKGNDEFIDVYQNKIKNKEKFKKLHKDDLLDRKNAIIYTGMHPKTFDRKVEKAKIIDEINGKRRFRIENLDKLMELMINSSKSALCIETYYCYDGNRRGFFPFESGEYYKVVDEDETSKYVFNEKWNVILRVGQQLFRNNFRVYEDLDLILSQINERERLNPSHDTSQKSPLFYTLNKAAALLGVSKQRIHNLIDSGKIASRSIDGNIRFTYEDIKTFCLKKEPNLAVCLENIVYIDKEKQYVVAFEKDKLYKITSDNNIWVSLYSNERGKSARFPQKRFSKLFGIAEDWQIETSKYSFNELG